MIFVMAENTFPNPKGPRSPSQNCQKTLEGWVFDPLLSHIKDLKNGTNCSFTALGIKNVKLGIVTGQLSVTIM